MRHQHFGSIHEVMDLLRSEIPENPFPETSRDGYVWVNDGGQGRLVPSPGAPFSSPFLYRGQTKRHPHCVPGVFRGLQMVDHPQKLSQLERAKCFIARVRLEEFLMALRSHPAHAYSKEMNLVVSEEALAQHYELATGRLDLTQDPDVAAFFATNWRDANGQWHPVKEGVGVVYRVVISHLKQVLGDERYEFCAEWIGKQAWPRPGEQKGWTLLVSLGVDFEDYPGDILTFDQRESCGVDFRQKFDAGLKLFPPDVLSEVVEAIKTAPTMARSLVSEVLTSQGCTGEMHDRELDASVGFFAHHFGIDVVDREPIGLSPEQLLVAQAQLEQMKPTFLHDVRALAVCRPISTELGAISRQNEGEPG
ncbi:FRG domain-containing protein [Dyella psychrodurans]|uniref:FRG domain-containing protein n=1 Tax=Dyella psychrodurans TaxID=1927960 RepID=A0A370X2L2_9GAMM|nr:FRG domain-containing protein [Dyella psychrodurans]RDS82596.1 FRG domain-containing protein [Dyella psychrodurans]